MFGLRSTRGRAILAGTVFVLLLGSMGALSVWRARHNEQLIETLNHTSTAATALEGAHAQFWQAQGALSALVISGDPVWVDTYDNTFAESEQHLAEARAEFLALEETDKVSAVDDLAERINQFNQTARPLFPTIIEGDRQAIIELASASILNLSTTNTAIAADLEEMVREAQQEATAEQEAAERAANLTLWLLLSLSGIALATGIGIVVTFVGSVVGPLAALRASVRANASGNLEARAKVSGPEEVASLAYDFNEMTNALAAKTKALEESEERYRLIAENSSDVIWTMDLNLRYTYVSPAITRIRGYTVEEAMAAPSTETMTPASVEVVRKAFAEELGTAQVEDRDMNRGRQLELEMYCKDGSTIWAETSMRWLRDPDGKPTGIVGVTRNISWRKRAEEALRESEEALRLLFENAKDAIFWADPQTDLITRCNSAAETLLEKERGEIIGQPQTALHPPQKAKRYAEMFKKHMEQKGFVEDEAEVITKSGEIRPVLITASIASVRGAPIVQGVFRDISERKRMEEERERLNAELEVRAVTDGLTGLYNHVHFFERLGEEVERSKRYNRPFAVVMMDVDNFKLFNDSRGHQAGDEVLRLIADGIRSGLRSSDLAFRYGGDEFAAILPHADSKRAQTVIDRINRRITKSLKQADGETAARLSLSVGVACFPNDGTTPDELVRIADTALYSAKRAARAPGVASESAELAAVAAADPNQGKTPSLTPP